MSAWWPAAVLPLIVLLILSASRHARWALAFRWAPAPLWCYVLPAAAVTLGWLPRDTSIYKLLADALLPFALAVLLLGADLPAILKTGARSLLAAAWGAVGIVAGACLGLWLVRAGLPSEAWKGAGALAGTWTGGTMNLLALRSVLEIPEEIFAPLILVDALIAYSWMALLVAASGHQPRINQWLRASPGTLQQQADRAQQPGDRRVAARTRLLGATLALLLALGVRWLVPRMPIGFITSANGWIIVLVTTAALALSCLPAVRRVAASSEGLGYGALYMVLAAAGAQARLDALWDSPMWLVLGLVTVTVHGLVLMLAGRALRVPLGMLATASQANIGGLVSAPLVGAVYHQSLAPVGLLLAMAGNALGTYAGMLAAWLSRWMTG
ncbi:MAG: hypothetical protein COV75_05165 [Candidatus Omnitrophica bacterium CG11_big_fil_rev_8_21_14_0_20_63_9]|nr:MAG: hypothetical protein COV75_05165 [Candidatus Omnitrophica bacterium CG11_big_fil_rev_8_21_14_0_20_63_9]